MKCRGIRQLHPDFQGKGLLYKGWLIVAVLWGIAMLNYLDRLTLTTMGDSIKTAIFEDLTTFPDAVGIGGGVSGVTGGALILGGGANFPNGMPWEGGNKVYYNKVYALKSPNGEWSEIGSLPHPFAYGVSVTFKDTVICAGGCDAEKCYAEVFRLRFDLLKNKVVLEELPSLPIPLAFACGVVIESQFYIAGGSQEPGDVDASSMFYALDLENQEKGWVQLPPCPGPSRIFAGAASADGCFYLAGGALIHRNSKGRQERGDYLKDVWCFDPSSKSWSRMADMPRPSAGMPSPAASGSDGTFLFFGGDDGTEQTKPFQFCTGFRRDVIRYDTQKNSWTTIGEMPASAARIGTPLVSWLGRYVFPSGELKPGVYSPAISTPMTNTHFGLLTSIFLWVYAVCSPFGGYLADRFGRSIVIIGSLFVWSLVTWLTGHTGSFETLIATRAVMGISEAFYIPAALALIADYHRGSTRSLATGIHMSGLYTGAAMGGLGGIVAELYGWRMSFNVFGGIGIAYAVLVIWVLRDVPRQRSSESGATHREREKKDGLSIYSALYNLFKNCSFLIFIAYFALISVAGWLITGWLPSYLQEHFHLGQGTAGLNATFYVQVAAFIGILVGGILADQLAKRTPYGRLIVPAIGFLIAAPFLFISAFTSVLSVAILGFAMFGLARGFSDANQMPILCQVIDQRYRATGYGVLNMAGCIAGGLIIYVGGVLKDHHVDLAVVFQFAAICLILAGSILFLVRPKY